MGTQLQLRDSDTWVPTKDTERDEIRAQLTKILGSPYFSASKRYPSFLRFIVERELAGCGDELKERTIGVELFGRELTYDTNADPIVRVTAAEVRKRLTQYYLGPDHADELRICVSSGSYVPHFEKAPEVPRPQIVVHSEGARLESGEVANTAENFAEIPSAAKFDRARWNWQWTLGVIFLVCVVTLMVMSMAWRGEAAASPVNPALKEFWKPYTGYPGTVVVSVGTISTLHPSAPTEPTPDMGLLEALQHYNIVPLPSAVALSKISGVLGEQHVKWRVLNADLTTFDDVQTGPTILIGAFSNPWTLRLTSKLRYSFQDSPEISRIVDKQAKVQPDWLIYRTKSYSSLVQDYGVVAHYRDSITGKLVVIAAGIGTNGTMAAGDFITDEHSLESLMQQAPKNWGHENFEAVIATQVIDGKSGPPRLVSAYFW